MASMATDAIAHPMTDRMTNPVADVLTDTAADTEFTLEVLAGLHRGVVQHLLMGEYIVGCSADCDLIFSDAAVAGRHCRLVLTPDGMVVTPLEGRVEVAGEMVSMATDLPLPIAHLQLGTISLALEMQEPPPASTRERLQRSFALLKSGHWHDTSAKEDAIEEHSSLWSRFFSGLLRKGLLLALLAGLLWVGFLMIEDCQDRAVNRALVHDPFAK